MLPDRSALIKLLNQEASSNAMTLPMFLDDCWDFIQNNPVAADIWLLISGLQSLHPLFALPSILKLITSYDEYNPSLICPLSLAPITRPVVYDRTGFEPVIYQQSPATSGYDRKPLPFIKLFLLIDKLSKRSLILDFKKLKADLGNFQNNNEFKTDPGDSKRDAQEVKPCPGDSKRTPQQVNHSADELIIELLERLSKRFIHALEVDDQQLVPYPLNLYTELKDIYNNADKSKPFIDLKTDLLCLKARVRDKTSLQPPNTKAFFILNTLEALTFLLTTSSALPTGAFCESINLMNSYERTKATLAITGEKLENNLLTQFSFIPLFFSIKSNLGLKNTSIFIYSLITVLNTFAKNIYNFQLLNQLIKSKQKYLIDPLNKFKQHPWLNTLILGSYIAEEILSFYAMKETDTIFANFYLGQTLTRTLALPQKIALIPTISSEVKKFFDQPKHSLQRDVDGFYENIITVKAQRLNHVTSIAIAIFFIVKNLNYFIENPIMGLLMLGFLLRTFLLPFETRAMKISLNHSVLHRDISKLTPQDAEAKPQRDFCVIS